MSDVLDRLTAALSDRYRIERELGAGGMATVYLAEDLKHKRRVALKVLRPELAAVLGAERFVQEITTTAALQHPHILPLFDSGTAAGFLYYFMPFIDGETLRAKLDRETQLGIDDAVRITTDVADALQYAHEHGVIHRDIKPENILLANGRPMVADFGIALAVSAAAGGRMTETGLSLGTPHYMSPEQATAEKEITARSDVYSLGSVLYEMLTGNPPHVGSSAQQIIMKIIADAPRPVQELRKSVPPNVAAAVAVAIEKIPADRFESAHAFADALKNTAFKLSSSSTAQLGLGRSAWKQHAAMPLAVTALVLLVATAWGWMRPSPNTHVLRFDVALIGPTPMTTSDMVISPDGSMLAVSAFSNGETAIYLRRLDGDPVFRKLAGTEGAVGSPTFSPNNQWLAFRRGNDGTLLKVMVSGGGVTTLARLGLVIGSFLHWGTDDQIIFSSGPPGLSRVAAAGGAPELLKKTVGAARYSFLLPDGSGVLFTRPGNTISLLTFATDSVTDLVKNATHPVYVKTGHLLYAAVDGGLFAVPFDLGQRQIVGAPVRVLDRVASAIAQRGFSVSNDGILVYRDGPSGLAGGDGVPTKFLMLTAGGKVDTLKLPMGRHLAPRFSPDGRVVAFEQVVQGRSGATDIHTFDLESGTDTRITFDGDNHRPIWAPDGKRLAFTKYVAGTANDLFVKTVDNAGVERALVTQPGNQSPTAWAGNDTIVFSSNTAGQNDIFSLPLNGVGAPKAYLDSPSSETELSLPPDRRLAVFTLTDSTGSGIWIRDYPVAQGKWQVSLRSGLAPRWSQNGQVVYYWSTATVDTLMRVRVDRTTGVVVRTPEAVLTANVTGPENWDVHPDGKRFIITVIDQSPGAASGTTAAGYVVALNWFTELKALSAKQSKQR